MAGPQYGFLISRWHKLKVWLNPLCLWLAKNMVLLDYFAVSCFIFATAGITSIGVVYVLPFLYAGYDGWTTWFLQVFGCFATLQISVNWLFLRFVDTSYHPSIQGAKPDGVAIGQNVCKIKAREDSKNGRRKDATTINMNNSSVMYVATEMPKAENLPPKRTLYPYFSWTPCLRCNRPRPPRCHHCPICNKCILKRDHHCFVAGRCVGYTNLRYFAVFLFWCAVGTAYGLVHFLPYTYYEVFSYTSYIDFIFPIAIIRAIFGYTPWNFVLLIVLDWFCMGYLLWSVTFLEKVKVMVDTGTTSFEQDFKMNVQDNRTWLPKLRSVFGNYWMLNFLLPLHFVLKPIDDPVIWPYIKA